MRQAFVLTILVLCCVTRAQAPQPAQPDRLHAYLITFGPGGEVYELFGHNMIWIHLPARGSDPAYELAYNWGEFSFKEHNFVWKFIQGRMIYSINTQPYDAIGMIQAYKEADRSVWVQELNLTQDQIAGMLDRLETNRLPQNAKYRYDYYRDNCSTRVRDAIDQALNGQLKSATQSIPTGHTYRWHTRRLTRPTFWLYTSLNFVMGHSVDQPISRWEEMFLPVTMMDHLREVRLANGQPLILSERQEYQSKNYLEANSPPRWFIWLYLGIGLVVAALLALLWSDQSKWRRIAWTIVALAWSLLGAFAGVISTWAWFFTDHHDARYNENWLQLTPFMVIMLILIPLVARHKRRPTQLAFYLASVFAVLSLLGLILKILRMFPQPNFEILALTIPANLGLAVGIWKIRSADLLATGVENDRKVHVPSHPQRAS